jgi:hypothetical protein
MAASAIQKSHMGYWFACQIINLNIQRRTSSSRSERNWTGIALAIDTVNMIQSVHVKTLNKPYIIFNFSIRVKNLEIIEMSYCAEREKLREKT